MSSNVLLLCLPLVRRAALGMVALVACVQCGEQDLPCNPTHEIGSCCSADRDCSPYICLDGLPGGYCSQPCSPTVPCQQHAVCVDIAYSGADLGDGPFCLQECGGGLPLCRPGHTCEAVLASGGDTVCF